MKRAALLVLAVVLLLVVAPLVAAASEGDVAAGDQSGAVVSAEEQGSVQGPVAGQEPAAVAQGSSSESVDVAAGLPKVTEQNALGKAARITSKIHGLASQVMPEITLVILVVGAILGIFWGQARRMVIFAIIALVIVLWAPFLVSLAVSLLNS